MKRFYLLSSLVLALGLALTACSSAVIEAESPASEMPVPGLQVTEMAVEPEAPQSTAAPSGGGPAADWTPEAQPTKDPSSSLSESYRDASAGFEVGYPSGWMVESALDLGTRASQASLSSWQHVPGDLEAGRPTDGTLITLVTYQWDPKGDLAAYVAQRKLAWEASGMTALSEETVALGNGQIAQLFVIETSAQTQVLFLFASVGDQYLQIAGEGDLGLARRIALSLRIDG